MLSRHEKIIVKQLVDALNRINEELDSQGYLLSDYMPGTNEPTGLDFTDLKAVILSNTNLLVAIRDNINRFVTAYGWANISSAFQNQYHLTIADIQNALDELAIDYNTILQQVPDRQDKAALAAVAALMVSEVLELEPLEYDTQTLLLNASNDLLDAMSYVLQNINPATLEPLDWTTEQIKTKVNKYLSTFYGNMSLSTHPEYVEMKVVADHVQAELPALVNLNKLANLGKYIDSVIPKVPLLRRV